jgi:hypothetical protein
LSTTNTWLSAMMILANHGLFFAQIDSFFILLLLGVLIKFAASLIAG